MTTPCDDSEYGMAPTEIEVAIYALRTFVIDNNRLASITAGHGHWKDGVCVAICPGKQDDPTHVPPAPNCGCGVYGFFTVEELFHQYGAFASKVIAVITAQGLTTIGSKGLKTAAARVLAYWVHDDEKDARACQLSCPDARRFYDHEVMARIYGLNEKTREGDG